MVLEAKKQVDDRENGSLPNTVKINNPPSPFFGNRPDAEF